MGKFKLVKKKKPIPKAEPKCFDKEFEGEYLDHIFMLIEGLSEAGFKKFLTRRPVPPPKGSWDEVIENDMKFIDYLFELTQDLSPEGVMEFVSRLRPWLVAELDERGWNMAEFRGELMKKYGNSINLGLTFP